MIIYFPTFIHEDENAVKNYFPKQFVETVQNDTYLDLRDDFESDDLLYRRLRHNAIAMFSGLENVTYNLHKTLEDRAKNIAQQYQQTNLVKNTYVAHGHGCMILNQVLLNLSEKYGDTLHGEAYFFGPFQDIVDKESISPNVKLTTIIDDSDRLCGAYSSFSRTNTTLCVYNSGRPVDSGNLHHYLKLYFK